MTATDLVRGLEARRAGSGWMARCPAHNDRNPSLAIREQGGRLLLHCHAGCSQAAVIAALKARGLWEVKPRGEDDPRIVAIYNYTDAKGELLYQTIRLDPKDFRQRRPDGACGWIWNLKGVNRVLYHLPEVLEAPIVFLVEGEKDVETLRDWGFVATTAPCGAKAPWLPSYTETLRDREVILIPDNDKAGWERAVAIAKALEGHAIVRALPLPQDCKDISDFFQKGHSECELIANLEGVANV